MVLTILGIAAIVIATIFSYKSARDYGRNRFFWPLLTFAVGVGLQVIAPIFIAIVLVLYLRLRGVSTAEIQKQLDSPAMLMGIICLILSFIGMGLILKFVSTIPEGKEIPPTKRESSLGLEDE